MWGDLMSQWKKGKTPGALVGWKGRAYENPLVYRKKAGYLTIKVGRGLVKRKETENGGEVVSQEEGTWGP